MTEERDVSHTAAAQDGAKDPNIDPLEREAYDWIVRHLAGKMTPQDIAAMKAWLARSEAHAAAYVRARLVWKALGPIAEKRMRKTGEAPRIGRRALLAGAIAAPIAYAVARPPLGLWPSYSELMADYRTGTGELRKLQLANAVSLDLNTKTSIAIKSKSASATEIALIEGETAISTGGAEMEVAVSAGSGRIVARQADFNLRCEESAVSVACLDGHLAIYRDGQTTTLGPRQQVHYSDDSISAVSAFDPENIAAWRQGKLVFDGTPVAEVIAEVNRYHRGKIFLMNDDIGRRRMTARLRTAEADKIITQIVEIFGARARYLPGGIVILT